MNRNPQAYLLALTDGGGTVPPELGVARRLVERGHRVSVLAEDSMADAVRRSGAEFIAWTESRGQFQDWELRTPTGLLRGMVDHMFIGPAPSQAQDTSDAIARLRPDLVLTSFSAVGAMMAAEVAKVPFDVLFPNVYGLPAEGMPPFGAGLRPARGPMGRLRDRIAGRASTALFDRYALAPMNALRVGCGLQPIAHSWDQLHRARRQLVLTSAGFDFPGQLQANVRYVGAILDDPAWAAEEAWTPPAGEEPLVLVALSSTFQNQTECLQRIVDALGTLPVRAVVTTGPAISSDAIRASVNATLVMSAPHRDVLRESSLVVTHGGHGTVIKTLAAGVPMVILPHGRDQADNAVRVTSRGAGIAIRRQSSAGRIRHAVAQIIDNPRYAAAAEQLGEVIRQDARGERLLEELEQI